MNMNNLIRLIILYFIAFIIVISQQTAFAVQDLGQVAQNIMEPVTVVSQFMMTACFVIGGSFLFTSIIKYVEHRRNPLASPISTVVFLFIAGIILILLLISK